MRRADAAELILSLVTSRERATAIAGDLLEEAEGAGSFWQPVARAAFGQLWGQVSTRRSGLGRAALRAFLLMLGFVIVGAVLVSVGELIAISVSKVWFGKDLPDWQSPVLTYSFYVCVYIAVGRRIARRWPGREGAVSFSLVVLIRALALAFEFVFWMIARHGGSAYADIRIDPVAFVSWNADLAQGLLSAVTSSLTDFVTLVGAAAYERAKTSAVREA